MTGPPILTTTTAGLQDFAGLLTLFGASQCERHIASALTDGIAYTTATSLSTFGSPGIIMAGVKALVASLLPVHWGICGAERLHYAGFLPAGKNLAMIMMDPEQPTRYLAESRLEPILQLIRKQGFNIEKVSIAPSDDSWVSSMLSNTAASAIASITAFIPLVLDSTNNHSFDQSHKWIFPVMKLVASFLVTSGTQLIIRRRIVQIVDARLRFIRISETQHYELEDLGLFKEVDGRPRWDPLSMSESALSSLKTELLSRVHRDPESLVTCTLPSRRLSTLQRSLRSRKKRRRDSAISQQPLLDLQCQFKDSPHRKQFQFTLWPFQLMVAIGSIFNFIGYIGCMTLVQSPSSSWWCTIFWLAIEVFLSTARMIKWSQKKQHICTSLDLRLSLESSIPSILEDLPFFEDVMVGEELILTPSSKFIQQMIGYSGVFPRFEESEDISVYYTLARFRSQQRHQISLSGQQRNSICDLTLFLTIHDNKLSTTTVYSQDDITGSGLRYWPSSAPRRAEDGILRTKLINPAIYHSDYLGAVSKSSVSAHYHGIMKGLKFRSMNPGSIDVTIGTLGWGLSTESFHHKTSVNGSYQR